MIKSYLLFSKTNYVVNYVANYVSDRIVFYTNSWS